MKVQRSAQEWYSHAFTTRSILFLGFGISGLLAGVMGVGLSVVLWVEAALYYPGINSLVVVSCIAFGMGIACLANARDARTRVRRLNSEEQWKNITHEILQQNRGWLATGVVSCAVVAVCGLWIFLSSTLGTTLDNVDRSIGSFFRSVWLTVVGSCGVGGMIGLDGSLLMMLRDKIALRRMLRSEPTKRSQDSDMTNMENLDK